MWWRGFAPPRRGRAPSPHQQPAIISPMKSASAKLLPVLFCLLLVTRLQAANEPTLGPLPAPVSNNAVAISHDQGGAKIFSFMGIGPKKTWDAVTTSTYEMDPVTGKWTEKRPVPGVAGRLAASAVALHDQVFIFGGYILDSHGGQTTVSDLNVFVPVENRYYRGKDIPVPVADAVVGVYRDRYIFVIGGWSTAKGNAVRNVQMYDTDKDTWTQATPLPGTPVFGHAGAIIGNTIVYVDGAYKNPSAAGPKYVASSECWMGELPFEKGRHHENSRGRDCRPIPATRVFASRRARGRWKREPAGSIFPAVPTPPITTTESAITASLPNLPP